jgi:ERCC4-type nuclease
MDDAPVHIVVNDREKAGGKVLAALAARGDATVEIARLKGSDYHVEHQLFLLQGLPGVGPEHAARLLARLGSVQAVMTASADDLATVDGIGEKTAAKMRGMVDAPGAIA